MIPEVCASHRSINFLTVEGVERSHTDGFFKIRQKSVDKLQLETSRLEKRLSRLTQLLANPPDVVEPEGRGLLWTFGGNRNQQRTLEQSIIAWEEDTAVPRCRFCQQEFSNYSLRRHHCRLCGRVVCGDAQTQCSSLVGLNVVNGIERPFLAMFGLTVVEKARVPVKIDVRMCKDCHHTLFSKADFDREIQLRPPDQRSYENLVQFEWGIRRLLPKFQKLLSALQSVFSASVKSTN
jgi:rabenosyn-5